MQEGSTTLIPGANIYKPHVEGGVTPLSLLEEALRANVEAAKQSMKKVK
jgi:hypothetical protein